jgi:hypothetical protein
VKNLLSGGSVRCLNDRTVQSFIAEAPENKMTEPFGHSLVITPFGEKLVGVVPFVIKLLAYLKKTSQAAVRLAGGQPESRAEIQRHVPGNPDVSDLRYLI